jgi:hypothetical protein
MDANAHMDWLDFAAKCFWPSTIAVLILNFGGEIRRFLGKTNSVKVKIPGGGELTVSGPVVDTTLQTIISDIVDIVRKLDDDDKKLYFNIRDARGGKTVIELLPSFKFSTTEVSNIDHERLRRLRDNMMIRPLEKTIWKRDAHPVITEFGRIAERICPDLKVPESGSVVVM